MKNYLIYGVVAVVILAVGLFAWNQRTVYHTEISAFELWPVVPESSGRAIDYHSGIPARTAFTLKSTAALTSQVIEKYLTITPPVKFSVERTVNDNVYEIVPEELVPDTVYSLKIKEGPIAARDYSWAYQVVSPFQVISTLPKDRGTSVPQNTGIEIEFNRPYLKDPGSYISIFPPVSGRFLVNGSKVTFIPASPLAPRTLYTVSIKKGLGAENTTDTLVEDTTFEFETSQDYKGDKDYISFNRTFSEFKPSSEIVFAVSTEKPYVPITVYSFTSAEEFVNSVTKSQQGRSWSYYNNFNPDLGNGQKVFSADLQVDTQKEKYSSISYVHLPQRLPVGYYAAVAEGGRSKDVMWFQVNPAASFSAFAAQKSLIWLKDIESGNNLSGVSITYNGKRVGTTGADGVIVFTTPEELVSTSTDYYRYSSLDRKYFVAELPTPVVIPFENEYGSASKIMARDEWWDYISLNKNIYLPTDTIRFWSLMKPREGVDSSNETTVRLSTPYWYYDYDQANAITYAETKLKASDFDTITGELSYQNLKPGLYELAIIQKEKIIARQTITVSAYIKPAYKILIEPNKTSVFAGEPVTFKVKAEFFDGTPVANTVLRYDAYGADKSNADFTLDQNGEASFVVTSPYADSPYRSSWPDYLQVSVHPKNSEEGSISARASVFVFGPRIHSTITQKTTSSVVTFGVKTREVVLMKNDKAEPYWNPESYLGNPVPGAQTTVKVTEIIHIKNQVSTYYDPINKRTYPVYEYKTEEKPVQTQIITSDGSGNAQFVFQLQDKKEYRFDFSTVDSGGRVDKNSRYAYGGYDYSDYSPSSYFSLNAETYETYKIGQPYTLRLKTYDGVYPPSSQNGFIFLKVNNGAIEYQIQDTPIYNGVFMVNNVPNISVVPGWFANGRFQSAYAANLSYDGNEKRLNISVQKDKEKYEPGENVSLNIRVTDKNNVPVRAELNLSALDEAVFSIRTDETDIITQVYRNIYSQVMVRTSNRPPSSTGGAEKGGGDGDSPRSKLEEVALYKSVVTDGSGNARVEFKLPDNITSWRLTTQAVTKDLYAGKTVNFIPVTLPFFIDATLNNTYLAGDNLTLRLRTFGTAANQSSVKYTVESPTLTFKKLEQNGGASINVNLGSLTPGIHEVTVRTTNGMHSDALTRKITVLPTYFTKTTSDYYEGAPGLKVQNKASGYTTLTFSSGGRGKVYNELSWLSWAYGFRLDQKGAAVVARNLLNTYFNEKKEAPEFDISKYQDYKGMQLLPYSSGDLELSALAAHLFDRETIKAQELKTVLKSALADTKTDSHRIARALYGLTAFNEPVLIKLQQLRKDPTLTTKDKVYIALAFEALGAKEEARLSYEAGIRPSLDVSSTYAYIKDMKGDDAITGTMLLAALAVSLDEPEAPLLLSYVEDHPPQATLVNFEKLLYYKALLPKLSPESVSFAYNAGSKSGSKTLENGETFTLTLSPTELASFTLSSVTGKLGVVASYEEITSPDSLKKDSSISLDRVYRTGEIVTSKDFKEGDIVRVDLRPTYSGRALTGAYQIVDYLPSGMRIADTEAMGQYYDNYGYRIYPTEINDQKVTFIVDSSYKNKTVYYYARVVSKGTYKAEPAVLQSLRNPEIITTSDADTIVIE